MTRTLLRSFLALTALLAALAVGSATASAAPGPAAPPPGSCPAVEVRSAEVVRTTSGAGIQVRGVMPHADTVLRLEAEQVDFVQQPDFWNYTVVGCGGSGPVVKVPFTTVFPAPTFPIGRCGIAVDGIALQLTGVPDCGLAL